MKNNQGKNKSDKKAPVPVTPPIYQPIEPLAHQIISAQFAASQHISGPIPSPEMLRQYEQLKPGMIDWIVKMADDEAVHRRSTEAQAIEIQGRDQKAYRRSELLGQIFGFAIGVTALVCATIMGVHGAQWSASIVGGGGVTGLVTAFIVGRNTYLKQRDQEIKQQREIQQNAQSNSSEAPSKK